MRRPQRVLIAGDDVVHRWDLAQTLVAQGLSVVGQDSVGPTR
jgi:AmiR/NasT family two-component response regulator